LTAALKAGQKRVQVQVFPFRMTETNMSRRTANPDITFWRQLQIGHDAFERDHVPPVVSVCDGRYAFRPANGDSDGSAPIDVSCPATWVAIDIRCSIFQLPNLRQQEDV